jgi:hypothetical protein
LKPPRCRICGSEHYGVGHVFAINTPKAAINEGLVGKLRERLVERGLVSTGPAPKTPNRRDRAAYNDYMRRKMREYRAKKKAARAAS